MKKIIKQGSWLFLFQSLTRVISFFYVIFLAKTLEVPNFGLYTVALSYFSIISSITDFGFNRFLIREVAKDNSKIPELLWNIISMRLIVTSILFSVFSVILYILDPDKMRVYLILLATLAILPQSIAFSVDAIFIAIQKLQFSGVSLFISSLSTTLIGLFLVGKGFGVEGAIRAMVLGQVIYFFILIIFLYRHQGFIRPAFNLLIIRKALTGSFPYGLLAVLGLLYFRIDTVLLAYLKGNFETGIYGAAYKFLEAATFVPTALSMALFPVLAKLHDSSIEDVKRLFFKSFKVMLGSGLVVVLGYVIILPEIIKILLPNYLSSIQAIRILSLSIPFMFIHVPAVTVLLSTDKYLKTVLILSIFIVLFNISMNLIFIPKFGFIAASWVTVISEVLSFTTFFLFIKIKILDK